MKRKKTAYSHAIHDYMQKVRTSNKRVAIHATILPLNLEYFLDTPVASHNRTEQEAYSFHLKA